MENDKIYIVNTIRVRNEIMLMKNKREDIKNSQSPLYIIVSLIVLKRKNSKNSKLIKNEVGFDLLKNKHKIRTIPIIIATEMKFKVNVRIIWRLL